MNWCESVNRANCYDFALQEDETNVVREAVDEYTMDRLHEGMGVDYAHVGILRDVKPNSRVLLSEYAEVDIERLAVALLYYAGRTPAVAAAPRPEISNMQASLERCEAALRALELRESFLSVQVRQSEDAA